jgi:hypothetical protein
MRSELINFVKMELILPQRAQRITQRGAKDYCFLEILCGPQRFFFAISAVKTVYVKEL